MAYVTSGAGIACQSHILLIHHTVSARWLMFASCHIYAKAVLFVPHSCIWISNITIGLIIFIVYWMWNRRLWIVMTVLVHGYVRLTLPTL